MVHQQNAKNLCVSMSKGDGSEVQSALYEWTKQRTVPNVFIGGKHIGGCDSKEFILNVFLVLPVSFPPMPKQHGWIRLLRKLARATTNIPCMV